MWVFLVQVFGCLMVIDYCGEYMDLFWVFLQSTFNNPEWFYRHVDNHVESAEQQSLSQQHALFCSWAGMNKCQEFSLIAVLPLLSSLDCPSISGCDAFFKIRYRLREHMRSHTQERLVACPTCGSMFSSNTKLFDHLQRQAEPIGGIDHLDF